MLANAIINLNWEFDPSGPVYNAKADEPGTFQNNVPGSGAAQGSLWVFGGGNPFTAAATASKAAFSVMDLPNKQNASFWSRFARFLGLKRPTTANSGRFYNPATDTWTNSPSMNELRSFVTGGAIGDSLIIAAGGYNGATTVASAETESVCAQQGTPTPTPSPTCRPGGGWSEVAVYPFAARGPFVVSDGTFYYTGGGYDGSNVHSDVFKYDPTANTYTPLASAPDGFFLSQAVRSATTRSTASPDSTWAARAPRPASTT